MVAIIADRDQTEALAVHVTHDVLDQRGQLLTQGRLTRLWHLAQVHGPHPVAPAIQHRDGRGRPLLPFPVAQRHIDTITTPRERRLEPTYGRPGLVQPTDHLIDLGSLAVCSHPCPET